MVGALGASASHGSGAAAALTQASTSRFARSTAQSDGAETRQVNEHSSGTVDGQSPPSMTPTLSVAPVPAGPAATSRSPAISSVARSTALMYAPGRPTYAG